MSRGTFILQSVLATLLLSSGVACTSIQFSEYDDAIKVTTRQSGAEIYYEGKKIGVTPALVRVPRGRAPTLELRYPGFPGKKIKIETHYRWWDSFLPNVILYPLAPLTIPLDLVTGTAWDLDNVEDIDLPGMAPRSVEEPAKTIAIAPPIAESKMISDQVGNIEYDFLKAKPLWSVRPFKETLGVFEDYQYGYEQQLKGNPRNELFTDLGVAYVMESRAVGKEGLARFEIRNVIDGKVHDTGEIKLPEIKVDRWDKLRWFIFGLIPNAASVDLSRHGLKVDFEDGSQISTKARPIGGWLGDASQVLGSVGLSNLIPPRGRRVFEGHIRLTSMVNLQMSEYRLPIKTYRFSETEFRLSRFVAGAGPEFYLETLFGTFYLDLFGLLGYSELEWNSPTSSGKLGRGMSSLSLGGGFYRYFSNRLALRLYSRAIGEDLRNWDWAIEQSQGAQFPTKGVSSIEYGLSMVLYFPEVARSLRQ